MMDSGGFAKATGISQATLERLKIMDDVLLKWSTHHNLIAKSTIPDRWSRHYLDSAQLAPLIMSKIAKQKQALPSRSENHTRISFLSDKNGHISIADMGSGAGFPGLVLGAMLEPLGARIFLIESKTKKANFLFEATRAMGLENVDVCCARIEAVVISPRPAIITARALAPLGKLLEYSARISAKETTSLFLKGQTCEDEIKDAQKIWHMNVKRHDSITSHSGTVLEIGELQRV